MTDNVISIAERLAQRRAISNDDPRANEERLRAANRMKLREIQNRYKTTEGGQLKWDSDKDRLRAAQALGELIEKASKPEAGKPEVTIATMKQKWRDARSSGKGGASEFHIHRYMISPKIDLADPQIFSEQADKIKTRFVKSYADRAQFVAKLAEFDPDESEIAIFRNTSLWRSSRGSSPTGNRQSVSDDAADAVAFLIERLSARIIRDTNLAELFSRMRPIPGQWDIRSRSFRSSSRSSGMPCLFQTACQDTFAMCDEGPPLPSVPLVRLWHAGLSFPARLSNEASAEPFAAQAILAPVTPEEGYERSVGLHIYREIRLVLGPTVNADALGPMFESRVHGELSILDDDGKELDQGVLDHASWTLPDLDPDGSAAILLNDCWHRVTPLAVLNPGRSYQEETSAILSGLHADSPFLWDFNPLADDKLCFENWWLSWTPVDAAHVAHWLDRPGDGRGQPVESLPDACEQKSVPDTWYPWAVLAQVVEKAIYDGRLEAALRGEIAHLRKAFETHETEWRTRMQEQTAELIAEFDSDLQATVTLPNQQTEKSHD